MQMRINPIFERKSAGPSEAKRRAGHGAGSCGRRAALLWAVLALVWLVSDPARAAQASFDEIFSTNTADFVNCQIKFTYTGPQTKTTPTLVLVGPGRSLNIAEFLPYRTGGVDYGNDDSRVIAVSVTADTLRKFVVGIGERDPLKTAGSTTNVMLSLMIERGLPPGEIVFEHLAGPTDISQIMNVLQGALLNEPQETKETVRRFRNFTAGPN
jgi:hypothetical protein